MKKVFALILTVFVLALCSCSKTPAPVPTLDQAKAICELAVMECRYHNVAKYKDDSAKEFFGLKKGKNFWIEYEGIVTLGIDIDQLDIQANGSIIEITLPPVQILSCKPDFVTSEPRYYVDAKSVTIKSEDETVAVAKAQTEMENAALSNPTLMHSAQQRVQLLLEEYIENFGNAAGIEYTINWIHLDSQEISPAETPVAPSAT